MANYYKNIYVEYDDLDFIVVFEDGTEILFSDDCNGDEEEYWVEATLYQNKNEVCNRWKERLHEAWILSDGENVYTVFVNHR